MKIAAVSRRTVVAFITLWLAGVGTVVWYALQPQEFAVLHINASHDLPELGHPVYGQFVYTQSLRLPEAQPVSRLEIPLHLQGELPVVRIYERGIVVREWRGTDHFAFGVPQVLAGPIEIQIDGRHIPAERAAFAPRIFIETADSAYPDGSYRIAENDKQGDIGLTVYGQRRTAVSWWLVAKKNPAAALRQVLEYSALALTVSLLPFAAGRLPAAAGRGYRSTPGP